MVKPIVIKTKSFLVKCKRVWYALKKPSKEEYKQTAKIAAIGVAVLGLLGFVISILMNVLF